MVINKISVYEAPKEVRSKMGNAARKKVIQRYTWEQHVKKIIQFADL